MLTPSQQTQIKNVVGSLILLGEMFTKFDVTCILRNEGKQSAFHSDVRAECDSLIANGILPADYAVSNISVNGSYAQVIHPNWKDPNQYNADTFTKGGSGINPDVDPTTTVPSNTGGTATAVQTPVVQAPVTQPVVAAVVTTGKRTNVGDSWKITNTDKYGRLCIPNNLIRKLGQTGVPVGGKVFLRVEQGKVTMSYTPTLAYPAGTSGIHKHYIVDKDQNVRLSSSVMKQAGLNAKPVNVVGDDKSIVVIPN